MINFNNYQNIKKLNTVKLGAMGENLARYFIEINNMTDYRPTCDDHGVDGIIETESGRLYKYQVKSVRDDNKVNLDVSKFRPADNFILFFIRYFEDREPILYVIPSMKALEKNDVFYFDKGNAKVAPRYILKYNNKRAHLFEKYLPENIIL